MNKPLTTLVTLVALQGMFLSTPPASAQTAGAPPFFPFMAQHSKPQQSVLGFPWMARTRPQSRQRAGITLPWMQGRPQRRNSFSPSAAGSSPFGYGMGGSGFGMPGMSSGLGMMTAPMMQGMVGFMAPFAVNYMVASMNPTTMGNFFGLMTRPSGLGMGGINPMAMMGSPMGGFGMSRPATTFPFTQPPRQAPATFFPFQPRPRPRARAAPPFSWPGSQRAPVRPGQQRKTPARLPFPFAPFNIVGK